eukprot:668892-Rhodomonas_salina.1
MSGSDAANDDDDAVNTRHFRGFAHERGDYDDSDGPERDSHTAVSESLHGGLYLCDYFGTKMADSGTAMTGSGTYLKYGGTRAGSRSSRHRVRLRQLFLSPATLLLPLLPR